MRNRKLRTLHGLLIHGITVVLTGHLDLAGCQILHRMISAPVTELQLVGLCPVGQSQQLVAQADPEHGIFSPKRLQGLDHAGHILGIPGTIGYKDTIRIHEADLLRCRIIGHHGHIASEAVQHTDDICLHAAVDGYHTIFRICGSCIPAAFAADTGHSIVRD